MSLLEKAKFEPSSMDPRDLRKPLSHSELMEQLIEAPLDKIQPDCVVKVIAALPKEVRIQLINFLMKNVEVLA